MAYLEANDVQAWLEQTKLTVHEPLDAAMESLHSQRVLGVLATRYDVTLWTDGASTPALVVQLIAMLYAASFYRRQYSEDLGNDPAWPVWLEKTAGDTLALIQSGGINIIDVIVEVDTGLQQPAFYPNDLADETDPRSFTMSVTF